MSLNDTEYYFHRSLKKLRNQLIQTFMMFRFSDLVERANQWITSHPFNTLVSCETVEKKISYAREASEGCVSYVFKNGDPPCLLKGLR